MKDTADFKYEEWNEQVAKYGIVSYVTKNVVSNGHLHSQVELVLVESGEVRFMIDGRELTIGAGGGVLICPHTIHSLQYTIPGSISTFIFGTDFLLDFMSFFESTKTPFVVLDKDRCPKFAQAQIPFLIEFSHEYNVGKTVVKGLLSVLLSGMMPAYSGGEFEEREERLSSYQVCRKLLAYVDDNITSDLSLKSIASALNIVPCYVSSVFSKNFNMTLNHYIGTKRIAMAKTMLISTLKPMSEIAYECGFSSVRSFNRWFKELEGMPPTQYRESFMNPAKSAKTVTDEEPSGD
ncbi:MAG: AraC family transcriptional regulator [Oscillospiraceae bacterium]|nr:AraC family transcriptional regulator [Oscillospiraceae bacterium]